MTIKDERMSLLLELAIEWQKNPEIDMEKFDEFLEKYHSNQNTLEFLGVGRQ